MKFMLEILKIFFMNMEIINLILKCVLLGVLIDFEDLMRLIIDCLLMKEMLCYFGRFVVLWLC